MRLIGQVGSGESPTTAEYSDGLVSLNAMLDSWRNDGLMAWATQEESLTLSNGVASYTVGPSGTLDTTRPVEVLGAVVRVGDYDYPVELLNAEEWLSLPFKTTTAEYPTKAYISFTMTTLTVQVYPIPTATNYLRIITRVPIAGFTATSENVSFPPGWEEAIATNLAIAISPEYETQPSAMVGKMAQESLKGIKRVNSRPIKSMSELSALLGPRTGRILTDEP